MSEETSHSSYGVEAFKKDILLDHQNPAVQTMLKLFRLSPSDLLNDERAVHRKTIIAALSKVLRVVAPEAILGSGGFANPHNTAITVGETAVTLGLPFLLGTTAAVPLAIGIPLSYALSRGIALASKNEGMGGRLRKFVEQKLIPPDIRLRSLKEETAELTALDLLKQRLLNIDQGSIHQKQESLTERVKLTAAQARDRQLAKLDSEVQSITREQNNLNNVIELNQRRAAELRAQLDTDTGLIKVEEKAIAEYNKKRQDWRRIQDDIDGRNSRMETVPEALLETARRQRATAEEARIAAESLTRRRNDVQTQLHAAEQKMNDLGEPIQRLVRRMNEIPEDQQAVRGAYEFAILSDEEQRRLLEKKVEQLKKTSGSTDADLQKVERELAKLKDIQEARFTYLSILQGLKAILTLFREENDLRAQEIAIRPTDSAKADILASQADGKRTEAESKTAALNAQISAQRDKLDQVLSKKGKAIANIEDLLRKHDESAVDREMGSLTKTIQASKDKIDQQDNAVASQRTKLAEETAKPQLREKELLQKATRAIYLDLAPKA